MTTGKEDVHTSEMICATATPDGTAALAVIRMSGRGSAALVEKLMGLEAGRLRGTRRKTGEIVHRGRKVDSVVALGWPEGASYTGEEMVEVICHGVPSTVRELMDILIGGGARPAEPGEFTRRAYLSGRMNPLQVMELSRLWSIEGTGNGITGRASQLCAGMLDSISRAREILEGDIEFEEAHGGVEGPQPEEALVRLIASSEEFRREASDLETGTTVLIMGPVNSGKSTLFNLLAGEEQALVSETPGTTRDGSSCSVDIRGRRVILRDSAGEGGSGIDGIAYRAAVGSLNGTEKVLWLSAGGKEEPPNEVLELAGGLIRVSSKSDLKDYGIGSGGWIRVSSVTGEGIEELCEAISGLPADVSLTGAAERIDGILREAAMRIPYDRSIAAELLKEAEHELLGIINGGASVSLSVERALSTMCVGK